MISVVGSINTDLVVDVSRRPGIGETIFGDSFKIFPGGKGANQAVCISKLGNKVRFFGCVGDDVYAKLMLDNLNTRGVITDCIKTVDNVSTGIAIITLVQGENSIIVVKGANEQVDTAYIDSVLPKLLESDYVLIQNEIPIKTVEYVIETCFANGIPVVYNPAPAHMLNAGIIEKVQYLIPNEHEAMALFEGYECLADLLSDYPEKMIVTLGKDGAAYSDGDKVVNIPALKGVKVVDTTGAGDTFVGAFVKALSDGARINQAITFAQCASGISIEKHGAQEGMPVIQEVMERFT